MIKLDTAAVNYTVLNSSIHAAWSRVYLVPIFGAQYTAREDFNIQVYRVLSINQLKDIARNIFNSVRHKSTKQRRSNEDT